MKFAPYSFSKASMYKQCPRKFKYRYIDNIKVPFVYNEALLKGGAIHSILEHYPNKSDHKLAEKYFDTALAFVNTELGKSIMNSPAVCEMSFGLTEDLQPCAYKDKNAMYRGFIDRIIVKDNTATIIDFKTGKYVEPRFQSYDQLMSYAVYMFIRYPHLQNIKISYVYVEHENAENFLVMERQYLDNYLNDLIQLIQSPEIDTKFPKNNKMTKSDGTIIDHPLCNYCDFKDHCDCN